jgi:glycosyltransferase involved in cell wall biosynthesis
LRILLITPVFHPEPYYLRGLPFAKGLLERGFEVEALTGFPSYPHGRIYPGYRQRLCQREAVEGVSVMRVPSFPSHDRSGLRRAATYLSMASSMALQAPWRLRPPDLVHVNQGPATLCLPAEVLQFCRGTPFLLDIQDLWPESVMDSGMLRGAWVRWLLHAWSRHTYRRARHIITLSEGLRDLLRERGVPNHRVSVLHNWCDAELEKPLSPRQETPDPHGLGATFNVIYAGNLGPLQALGTVLEAAARLQNSHPQLRLVLVGSGLAEEELQRAAMVRGLRNVRFLPRQPLPELQRVLAFADAILVHLSNSPLNHVGIPSKLQHALAAGRPVLAGVAGAAAELMRRAEAGLVFEPEDAGGLAEAIGRLQAMAPAARAAMGTRGRAYYLANLSFQVGMSQLTELYRRLATPRR